MPINRILIMLFIIFATTKMIDCQFSTFIYKKIKVMKRVCTLKKSCD